MMDEPLGNVGTGAGTGSYVEVDSVQQDRIEEVTHVSLYELTSAQKPECRECSGLEPESGEPPDVSTGPSGAVAK